MSVKTASTISAAERELRERVVADAAHSSAMEGLTAGAEYRADAAAYAAGSSTSTSSDAAHAPAGALPDFVDPYLEPESGILRNRLGLTDRATLDRAEAELTEWRRAEMITRPVNVTGDLRQLQAIHRQLFQDVYDWAGQLRTVDIRKGTDPGAEFFMPVSRLESGAGYAFAELAVEHQLHGLDRDRFVDRLAHHYDQVNYLHPFREGNGRTQRIFWTQIAAGAGFDLDWSRVTGAENDQASRTAMERQNFTELRGIFDRIVHPAAGGRLTPERMEQLRAFANLSSSVAPGRSAPSTSTGRSRRPMTPGREAEQGRDL